MSFIPKPQEIYKHFKGNLYQIVTVAEHSETGKQLVVYQAMYGDFKTYARDLDMFISRVDREKYPDAVQEFRFELQGPGSERQRAECGGREDVRTHQTTQDGASREEADTAAQARQGTEAEGTAPKIKPESEAEVRPEPEAEKPAPEVQPAAKTEGALQESAAEQESADLDPMLMEFLDADSYEEKLNILAGLHHRITQDMITAMAVSNDIEVEEGDLEGRYLQLKNCLLMREKYECKRMN